MSPVVNSLMLSISSAVAVALLLDWWLGEAKKHHPLVGFGRMASLLESRLREWGSPNVSERACGLFAWLLLVVPVAMLLSWLLKLLPGLIEWSVGVLVLYFTVGLRSLQQHALAVAAPLMCGDLNAARNAVARIVSRDTQQLDEPRITAATVETVLENGNDAVAAPLFWFVVAGPVGALVYRLVNTLDAMWGYRNERYQDFGFVAAKADDLLSWIPARLCAFTYCLMGDFTGGRKAMSIQGPQSDSPNAGRVIAAGAGALGVQVGGQTSHGGETQWRPQFGFGRPVEATDIERAVGLLHRAVLCWVLLGLIAGGICVAT